MPVVPYRDQAEPLWEQLVNELKNGEQLESAAITEAKLATGAVTAAKIGTGAVTEAKIGANAVTESKIASAAVAAAKLGTPVLPAEGAENTVTVGAASPVRKVAAAIVGNNAETKFKIAHGITTGSVVVAVYKSSTKKIANPLLNAAGVGNYTYTATETEVEIVFGTAPAAKELFYVVVMG